MKADFQKLFYSPWVRAYSVFCAILLGIVGCVQFLEGKYILMPGYLIGITSCLYLAVRKKRKD